MKILHIADIQVDISQTSHRNDEYVYAFKKITDTLRSEQYDILAILGDVFERYSASSTEQKIFTDFLHEVKSLVKEIVLIEGNHDIKQRFNTYFVEGEERFMITVLDYIVASVQIPNLTYMNRSGIYKSDQFKDLYYLTWGQRVKYMESNDPYNPLNIDSVREIVNAHMSSGKTVITLFHDMLKDIKNFDGKSIPGSESKTSFDEFITPLVLAGDIHVPAIYEKDNIKVTYPSSLVHRHMGEGDKFSLNDKGFKIYQRANDQHGYNTVDTESNSISFIPIIPYICYNTIDIDTPERYKEIKLVNFGFHGDFVRLRVNSNFTTFIELESAIVEHVKSLSKNVKVEILYGNVLSDSDLDINYMKTDFNSLLTDEKLREVSFNYVETVVNKTKMNADHRSIVKDHIIGLLNEELSHVKRHSSISKVKLLDFEIDNFMAFGNNVVINKLPVNAVVRIKGSNGIGKTTFFHFVKWMFTDFIFENQNANYKKENRLACFNDHRFLEDQVKGKSNFTINGVHYTLSKVLTRYWKKDTSVEQKRSKNWKEFIDGIPTLEINLMNNETGETITEIEKLHEFVWHNMGSLYTMNRSIFLNQFTVWEIVNKPAADRNSEILNNLGLSIFSEMYDRYESVKESFLSKFKLHPYTSEQYFNMISECKNNIELINVEIANTENDRSLLETEITSIDSQLLDVNKKYRNDILSVSHYENENSKLSDNISKIKTTVSLHQNRLSEIEVLTSESAKTHLQKSIDEKSKIIAETTAEINKLKVQLEKIKSDINEQKSIIDKRKLEIDNEVLKRTSEQQSKISKIETEISTLTAMIVNIKTEIQTKITSLRTEQESLVKSIENDIKNTKLSISNETSNIELLKTVIFTAENSKVCQECNRPYDEGSETYNVIVKKINANKEKLETHTKTLVFLNAQLVDLEKTLVIAKTSYEKLHTVEFANENFSVELEKINSFSKDIAALNIQKSDLSIEIESIKNSVDYANDSVIVESNSNILKLDEQFKTVHGSIKSKEGTLFLDESELNNLNSKKDEMLRLADERLELTKSLNEYQNKISSEQNSINENLEKISLANINDELKIAIESLTVKQTELLSSQRSLAEKIQFGNSQISVNTSKISDYELCIKDNEQYKIANDALRIYKQILGKKGLQNHVFGIVKNYLNTKLNAFLEELNFRLIFDEDNELKLVDLSKKDHSIRNVTFTSGMQTTFMALSLITVLGSSNAAKQFDTIFIDELTGQLNNGNDLSYKSLDYQEQFVKILQKMKEHFRIFVVDHVIEDLQNEHELEVIPTEDGAIIK